MFSVNQLNEAVLGEIDIPRGILLWLTHPMCHLLLNPVSLTFLVKTFPNILVDGVHRSSKKEISFMLAEKLDAVVIKVGASKTFFLTTTLT